MKTEALKTPISTAKTFELADEVLLLRPGHEPERLLLCTALLAMTHYTGIGRNFEIRSFDQTALAKLEGDTLVAVPALTAAYNQLRPALDNILQIYTNILKNRYEARLAEILQNQAPSEATGASPSDPALAST
jgi:hypothetical protein